MLRIFRHQSLRTKIIIWAFVPTAIILGAVALVTFNAYRSVTEELVIERDRELTRLTASQLSTEMEVYLDLLDPWARTASFYEWQLDYMQTALEGNFDLGTFTGGVVVFDSQGNVLVTEPRRPDIEGQNWGDRDYIRQIARTQDAVMSNIVPDGPDETEVIVIAVPVFGRQREFLGSVAGLIRLDHLPTSPFYQNISDLLTSDSGSVTLVDGNGRVIAHTDLSQGGQDYSDQALVQRALSGEMGALRTEDASGQEIVASFAPVPGTSWALVARESWAALSHTSRGYIQFLLFLLLLGGVVPAAIVMFGVRYITRPVESLINAAREISGGNFGQRIVAETGDEIEELAKQFNRMATHLQESYTTLETRVADRTQELATLNQIAGVVSRSLDLNEILRDALGKTLQVMEIEAGGIYLLDPDSGLLNVAAYEGISKHFVRGIDGLKLGENFSGQVAQVGKPLVVTDVATDTQLARAAVRDEGFSSLAVVPLSSRGRVLGTMFTAARSTREFTPQDVELLSSIGSQIAVAVENARLFAAQQRRAEQFRLISEVGRRITSILDIDQLLDEIVRLVNETLGYYLVGIGLVEDGYVVMQAGAGACWEDPNFVPPKLKIGGEGITGWVVGRGEPLVVTDVAYEDRFYYMAEASETRSELAVPIRTKDEVIGVLDVQSDRINAFDESDLVVLQSLASQAAIAIDNARLYEQARQVAAMEERNRLAHDLHDAVSQTLWTASLISDILPNLYDEDPDEAHRSLGKLRQLTRGALAEMRTLLLELRPAGLAEAELSELLRQLVQALVGRKKMTVELDADSHVNLPTDVKIALYRIAQEGLNNITKHAHASQVVVRLQDKPDCITLTITDDGVGFDPSSVPPDRLGLGIMAERAETVDAKFVINSVLDHGTQVQVTWSKIHEVEQA